MTDYLSLYEKEKLLRDAVKMTTYRDVDIYVNHSGKFLAIMGNKMLQATTLNDLQKKIDPLKSSIQAIKIYDAYSGVCNPSVVTVSGYDKRTGKFRDQDRKLIDEKVLVYDADLLEKLLAIDAQITAATSQKREILNSSKRLRPEDI